MKTIYKTVVLIFLSALSLSAQNKEKIDSVLSLLKTIQNEDVQAANYLELVDLTLYHNPKDAKLYIEKSIALYQKTSQLKGLAKSYGKKAIYFNIKSSKDSVKYYLNKSIATYLDLGDTLEAARVRYNLGILNLAEGNHKDCLDIINTNIPIFEKENDSIFLGSSYMMKGKVAITRGFYNIALKEVYRALEIHQNLNSELEIAEDFFQLGVIQSDLLKHEEAITSYEDSYILFDKLDYNRPKAQALSYIGLSNLNLQQYDKAKEALVKALQLSKEIDYTSNIARTYIHLGMLEYELTNYSTSRTYLKQGIDVWKSIGGPHNLATAQLKIGKTYTAQKDYTNAIDSFNESIRIADSIDASQVLVEGYINRAISFEKRGEYKAAYLDYKKSQTINDSLLAKNQSKVIEELHITYETEKKEHQIENQDKAIRILEQKAKIKNLQYIISFITLCLAGIIFVLVVYRIKKKNKQKIKLAKSEIELQQNEKLKAEFALSNRQAELKKVVVENSITEEVLNETLDAIKVIMTYEDPRERQLALKSMSASLLSNKVSQNINASLQSYLDSIGIDFKVLLDTKFSQLNSKEKELLCLMKAGLTTSEISQLRMSTVPAVKSTRYRIRKKLGLDSTDDIIAFLEEK